MIQHAPLFDHPAGVLGPLGALGSSLTWALGSAVYARWAATVGALEVNLSRAAIVLPLFLCAAWLTLGSAAPGSFSGTRLSWLALSTVCSYGLGDLLFYLSALRLGTATALAIASVYPVWAAVLGALTLGERLTAGRLGGTALCVGGVTWLVMLTRGGEGRADGARRRPGVGVALAALTSLLWAGNTYAIRRGATGIPMLAANSFRFGLALAGLLLARTILPGPKTTRLLRRGPGVTGFVLAAVIEGFLGSSMFVYGLSHADLAIAAPLSSLAPLFAVPIGLWLGTERLSLQRLCAIVATVAGVLLLVR
jgi:drug/metabolite transporter (DMT)-like permease